MCLLTELWTTGMFCLTLLHGIIIIIIIAIISGSMAHSVMLYIK